MLYHSSLPDVAIEELPAQRFVVAAKRCGCIEEVVVEALSESSCIHWTCFANINDHLLRNELVELSSHIDKYEPPHTQLQPQQSSLPWVHYLYSKLSYC